MKFFLHPKQLAKQKVPPIPRPPPQFTVKHAQLLLQAHQEQLEQIAHVKELHLPKRTKTSKLQQLLLPDLKDDVLLNLGVPNIDSNKLITTIKTAAKQVSPQLNRLAKRAKQEGLRLQGDIWRLMARVAKLLPDQGKGWLRVIVTAHRPTRKKSGSRTATVPLYHACGFVRSQTAQQITDGWCAAPQSKRTARAQRQTLQVDQSLLLFTRGNHNTSLGGFCKDPQHPSTYWGVAETAAIVEEQGLLLISALDEHGGQRDVWASDFSCSNLNLSQLPTIADVGDWEPKKIFDNANKLSSTGFTGQFKRIHQRRLLGMILLKPVLKACCPEIQEPIDPGTAIQIK
jgi:hypothetical protein